MGSASNNGHQSWLTRATGPGGRRAAGRAVGLSLACLVALGACGDNGIDGTTVQTNVAPSTTRSQTTEPSDTEAGGTDSTEAETPDAEVGDELFPDVIDATGSLAGDGTWTISATISSPYDSAERYADAWRVVGPDGTVYGIRELAHDHAAEQPFTRSQSGIEIPADVDEVTIEGRDQVSGWGGATVALTLDRS